MKSKWDYFLKYNASVRAYFQEQGYNSEQAEAQLDAVLEKTVYSKSQLVRRGTLIAGSAGLGIASVFTLGGYFGLVMGSLFALSQWLELKGHKKATVVDYTRSLANDFAQSVKWAKELGVENTYKPKPLIPNEKFELKIK